MSALDEAALVLGVDRVAEIRAGVEDLLKQVLANRARYARKRSQDKPDASRQAS
jgi:hypothetical protein